MNTGKRLFILLAVICVMAPAVQAADFSVGGGIGSLELLASDGHLKANLLPSSMWQIGPVYNYRMERKDVKNNAVDDMKTVDGTSELGIFGGGAAVRGQHGTGALCHQRGGPVVVASAYPGE